MSVSTIKTLIWEVEVHVGRGDTEQLINHIEKVILKYWEEVKPIIISPWIASCQRAEKILLEKWMNVPVIPHTTVVSNKHKLEWNAIFIDDIELLLDACIINLFWEEVYTIHNLNSCSKVFRFRL